MKNACKAMSILNSDYNNDDDNDDDNDDNDGGDDSGGGIADRVTKKEWWVGMNGLQMVP